MLNNRTTDLTDLLVILYAFSDVFPEPEQLSGEGHMRGLLMNMVADLYTMSNYVFDLNI